MYVKESNLINQTARWFALRLHTVLAWSLCFEKLSVKVFILTYTDKLFYKISMYNLICFSSKLVRAWQQCNFRLWKKLNRLYFYIILAHVKVFFYKFFDPSRILASLYRRDSSVMIGSIDCENMPKYTTIAWT